VQRPQSSGQDPKEAEVKLFTSYLVVVATAIAAFAPVAQASNPGPAVVRALEIRGQGMNNLCNDPTLSRESYVAVCGTKGAANQPTRAELRALQIRGEGMDSLAVYQATTPDVRALQIRGEAMNALCQNPTLSRESYVAVCGTKGASNQPTRAELRALQIRGEAMDAVTAVPVSVTSGGFDWGDFSIGAASMLGLVLLAGGITAGVHYGRKSGMRPRPAS
jgi:hypothetical protein